MYFLPNNLVIHLKRASATQFQTQQSKKKKTFKINVFNFLGPIVYVLRPHPDSHTRLQICLPISQMSSSICIKLIKNLAAYIFLTSYEKQGTLL